MVKMKAWGVAAALLLLMGAVGTKSGKAAESIVTGHDAAERALMQGQVDAAVSGLREYLNTNPKDAQAHLLLCRALYAEELPDAALNECDAAMNGLSGSSEAQDWLGRACGQKAQSAGPITGYRLARRVQAAFERSVELDPKNGSAVDDLGEYYLAAPAIIGGGVDKAEALAERELKLAPQAAHRTLALAAEANKDYVKAENEFRSAVTVAGKPDAWADLGHFYARRKQYDQAVEALRKCLQADPSMDAAVVDAASILMEVNREPELAEKMLRGYLSGKAKSDDAPAFKVHELLGRLLLKKGDKTGAKIEFEESLAMAHDYASSKKALQSL
jgi:tetratricopeptide (TPR) repeat protein